MITKDEHIILSNYLINQINFDRVYNDCTISSKRNFSKRIIIDSVKKMIKCYPHFDISSKGRIESFTLLFTVRKGTYNNYMYFISNKNNADNEWYMNEKRFKQVMFAHDDRAYNVVWFNMKEYLKRYKLDKLINNLK